MTYRDRPWLASYPPGVPADLDVPAVPLTRLLDDAARDHPDAVAISYLGNRISYASLRDSVDRFAGSLAELGVGPMTRVAVILPNCPQHVVAFFAVLRLGAVVVHCNPLAPADELAVQLDDSGTTVVVCLDRIAETVLSVRERTRVGRVVITSLADGLSFAHRARLELSPLPGHRAERRRLVGSVPADGDLLDYRALVRDGSPARQAPVEAAHEVAVLQYTSGTAAAPKAAMLSHTNLVASAYQVRLWLPDLTEGREVTLAVLPLFHVYGLTLCMLATTLLAGRLVLLPRFEVDAIFDAIDRERPTIFPGVPPIFRSVLDSPKLRNLDVSSIRACVSGAMKLPVEVRDRFERATGALLVEGYGMTETSATTLCQPLAGPRRAGSVGVPLPGTAARIVDPEDPQRELPVGEAGELAVSGPQVFLGYWQREADVAPPSVDGWWLTGDLAVMDAAGWFSIVDRKKDLIIAGGFNISPSEVEEVVLAIPGVADCCVVGLPDRYRGETVKVYVVASDAGLTEDDIRAACTKKLSAYKVPKLVERRDELPRSATGKALRRQLVAEELAKEQTQPDAAMKGLGA